MYASTWLPINPYGFLFLPMSIRAPYRTLLLHMASYNFFWLPMFPYGSLWIPMAPSVSPVLPMFLVRYGLNTYFCL